MINLEELGNEMRQYLKDLKNTIKDKKTLEYLLDRTENLYDMVFNELREILYMNMEEYENGEYLDEEQEDKIDEIEMKIESAYEGIYEECGEQEYEIYCPNCGEEFEAVVRKGIKEIVCPECDEVIKLEWD